MIYFKDSDQKPLKDADICCCRKFTGGTFHVSMEQQRFDDGKKEGVLR